MRVTRDGLFGLVFTIAASAALVFFFGPYQEARHYSGDQLPIDQQWELIDSEPPVSFESSGSKDVHDWPEWRRFRDQFAKKNPACMVCGVCCRGNAIHHGWSAKHLLAIDRPDLCYTEKDGMRFWTLCPPHHAEFGHGIGRDPKGSWHVFNPDIDADVSAKKWNSRGKSKWEFKNEQEVSAWLNEQIEANKLK